MSDNGKRYYGCTRPGDWPIQQGVGVPSEIESGVGAAPEFESPLGRLPESVYNRIWAGVSAGWIKDSKH